MTRHCILYARVSSEDQLEGPSLQTQLEACRRYAAEHGLIKVGEFSEDFTGTTLNRPEFQRALRMFEAGQADALIVAHQDRLSRNYLDFLVLRDQLEKADVELHFVSTGQSQSGFSGLLTDSVLALLAHGERERMQQRMKDGRDGRAARGEYNSPKSPYGYYKSNKHLEINPVEAEVVRSIFDWYAGVGGNPPMNLRAIVRKLTSLHIPSPEGGHWYPGTVRKVLSEELYIGHGYFGKSRIIDGVKVHQPKEKWIPIPVEPIVSEDVFNICQLRVMQNKATSRRNQKQEYLLAGFLRCGCGRALAGTTRYDKGRALRYYSCTGKPWSVPREDRRHDKKRFSIPCDYVDERTLSFLARILNDENYLQEIIREQDKQREMVLEPKREYLQAVEAQLERHLSVIDRLVQRIGDVDDDDVAQSLKNELEGHVAHKRYLQEQKILLLDELSQEEIPPITEAYILETMNDYKGRLANATFQDIRNFLTIFNAKVDVVFDDDPKVMPHVLISLCFRVPIDITYFESCLVNQARLNTYCSRTLIFDIT